MSADFEKALLGARFINFTNQILQVQLSVNKMEMDIIRKCQGKSQKIDTHPSIIQICRKTIQKCDVIIKDVKDYFQELRIYPAYELFESIFKIMTYFIRTISQSYLYRYQHATSELPKREQSKQLIPQNMCGCGKQRKVAKKQIQQIDYELAIMQKKQMMLALEMKKITDNLIFDRQKIEKISCDKKNQAFKQLEITFSEISQKIQNVLNTFFKNSQVENKQLFQIVKSEHLKLEIKKQLKQSFDAIVPKCLKKVIAIVINNIKENKIFVRHKRCLTVAPEVSEPFINKQFKKVKKNFLQIQAIKVKRSHSRDINADQNIAKQQINIDLLNEIKKMKKQVEKITKQCEALRQKLQISESISKETQQNCESYEKLFKKRTFELEETKAELSWTTKMSDILKRESARKSKLEVDQKRKKKIKIILQQKGIQTQSTDDKNQIQILSNTFDKTGQKSKFMSWMHKKKLHQTNKQIGDSNNQSSMKNLVEKMNEYLKLTVGPVITNNQSNNIEQIIIKWKKGINQKVQENAKQDNLTERKQKRDKKKHVKQFSGNIKKIGNKNNKIQTQIEKKQIGIQTIAQKTIKQSNVSTAGTLQRRNYRKSGSQDIFPNNNYIKQKTDNYNINIRSTLNSPSKILNHNGQTQATVRIINQKKSNNILQCISAENRPQIEDISNQKNQFCFEQISFNKFDNKPDRFSKLKKFMKQKSKKLITEDDDNVQKNWKQNFDWKRKERTQDNQSVLIKLEKLDFAIWSAKIEQFIKGTKQMDPNKYTKLLYNFLEHMRDKTDHLLVTAAYQKYLASYDTLDYLQNSEPSKNNK